MAIPLLQIISTPVAVKALAHFKMLILKMRISAHLSDDDLWSLHPPITYV